MDDERRASTNPIPSHYSRTVHQHSLLFCIINVLLSHGSIPPGIPFPSIIEKTQSSSPLAFAATAPYLCSWQLLIELPVFSVSSSLLTHSSSFSPHHPPNCSSQGQQWWHMANSTVLILFDSAAFFLCFQDYHLNLRLHLPSFWPLLRLFCSSASSSWAPCAGLPREQPSGLSSFLPSYVTSPLDI